VALESENYWLRLNRQGGSFGENTQAYNLSAEDVRNARTRFGQFDVLVKSTSYGSITAQAEEAANSMGAQTLTFGELMRRLSQCFAKKSSPVFANLRRPLES